MAAARSNDQGGDQMHPDDSASGVGSRASWSVIQTDAPEAPAQKPEAPPGIEKTVWEEDSDDDVPPSNWAAFAADSSNAGWAPATQAAKHLLGNKEKQTAKLAQQKARAKARGHKAVRWGQMPVAGALNPQNYQLPPFITQLGSGEEERSVLIVDARDQTHPEPVSGVAPGWDPAQRTVRDQHPLGSSIGSFSSYGVPHEPFLRQGDRRVQADRGWIHDFLWIGALRQVGLLDGVCALAPGVPAIQVAHHARRFVNLGGRQGEDRGLPALALGAPWISVLTRTCLCSSTTSNEGLVMTIKEVLFVPSVAVTIFQGWRVVATSFEVGGRLYVCSEGGVVVALDHPLCHFEVRMTALSSADSIGMDADRLEFRFRTSGDKIDVACSQVMVPSTWLVLSRVSGPTLIQNARWCRDRQARVEGPDQTMQMSQLAGIHAHWTAATEAFTLEETGPRVGAVAVDTHVDNFHLTCESPLFKSEKVIVPKDALALQYHDRGEEKAMIVVPPVAGGPAAIPVEKCPRVFEGLDWSNRSSISGGSRGLSLWR